MTRSLDSRQLFGVRLSPQSNLQFPDIRDRLAADDAVLTPDSDSFSVLAHWGLDAVDARSNPDGIAAALLGNPRLKDASGNASLYVEATAPEIAANFGRTGTDLLENLAGNFSLAVVDNENQKLFLAIDRLGIESIYYLPYSDGGLVFSTDLALIKKYACTQLPLAHQAIYDYAYFHTVPSPLTIYSGVYKLPPSHALLSTQERHVSFRYWRPSFSTSISSGTSELNRALIDTLRGAVTRSLRQSESQTGGFLSGGLDSSTICGLLAEVSDETVKAVSVGFDQAGYDEISYARAAARHFGLEHLVHYITPDEVADSIPLIADKYPEPFGNSSVVPTYICALTARQNGISTLLAGDGGDELFAGNSRYVRQKLFELYYRLPSGIRSYFLDPLFSGEQRSWHVGPLRKLYRYIEQARIPLPDRLQTENMLETQHPAAVFSKDFLSEIDTAHPLALMREEFSAAGSDADVVDRMLLSDWRFTLADNDIRKVTQMCELAGIIVRYPLLDDDVVDFSLRIPSSLKIRRLRLRYFYRQALKDFLPSEVIDKSKHGFGLPFGEWLLSSKRLQDMVYDALNELGRRDIFDRNFIGKMIDDHRKAHAAYYGNMVWVLAMLEWWLASHDSRSPRR